MLACWH